MRLGYALSSEEQRPEDLVRLAQRAEAAGFDRALISDHYHPWIDRQGQSPFVWAVLGAIAQATTRLRIGTGVTCPIARIHPAVIAQAAATAACLLQGRFMLGLGTGEALNEHITGERWPPIDIRQDRLVEAIEIIRLLWTGDVVTFRGDSFSVESARVYSLPDTPPPIYVAAAGEGTAELAARLADGLISTAPDKDLVSAYRDAGGTGPVLGQVTVCWAENEEAARKTALARWPNAALGGELSQELATPRLIEDAARNVRPEDLEQRVVCGPDPQRHMEAIHEFGTAGFDDVYVHQVGSEQDGFFDFYERNILTGFD